MAKRKAQAPIVQEKKAMKRAFFTTVDGIKIPLKRIPPWLVDNVKDSIPEPERPYYEITTVAGKVEKHPIDAKYIEGEDVPEEDKIKFWDYEAKRIHAEETRNERVMNALLLKGVDLEAPTEGEEAEWMEVQEFLGVKLPEKKHELKLHYIKTELLTDPEDIANLTLAIMENTGGVKQTDIENVRNSFQDILEGETPEGFAD